MDNQSKNLQQPSPFLDNEWLLPWISIDKSAEIALLKELQRELPSGHVLFGSEVEIVARRIDNDDILLKLQDSGEEFAVVHLTWSGQKEKSITWPRTLFFKDFDTWVRECMEKDFHSYS